MRILPWLLILAMGCAPRVSHGTLPITVSQTSTPTTTTAVPRAAAALRLSVVSGDSQTGPAALSSGITQYLLPLVVSVTRADGTPVDDVQVVFTSDVTVLGLGEVVSGWGLYMYRNPTPGEAATLVAPYTVGPATVTASVKGADANTVTFHLTGQ